MNEELLGRLSSADLFAVSDSLRSGSLSSGISRSVLAGIIGHVRAPALGSYLEGLHGEGFTSLQLARLVETIAKARVHWPDPGQLFSLVLSGPEVSGDAIADTATTVRTLIEEAKREIWLISYAVHQGQTLFERLAARMRENRDLRVSLYLDISRGQSDSSLDSEIVGRFAQKFWTKQWPWPDKPSIFYDPRSLSLESTARTSFHAKGVVVDQQVVLLTSANFTEAAQQRNVEAGILIRYKPLVKQFVRHLEGLRTGGQLAAI